MTPLRLLRALFAVAVVPWCACAAWKKGIVLGGEEWTAPGTSFGTASADASLRALAATGADHVRILATQFTPTINSTLIAPLLPPSPLASATLPQLRATIRAAHALNLSVFLAPILDPNWDVVTNGRSITPPAGASAVSRLQIGASFTEELWAAWFVSYAAFVLPLAKLAAEEGVSMFEIASELDVALTTRGPQWRALIAAVRAAGFAGPLYVAANPSTIHNIDFWDALDAVGVDAYYDLGETLPLGVAPTVAALVAAWAPIAADLRALSAKLGGLPILFTEVGYQSRPSCHARPWGTVVHDPLDDSAWLEDHDMACQANAYEALLRVFSPEPWWGGVFLWLWHADASAGGTGDSDFTPHGKPAEAVLRKWFGAAAACSPDGAYGSAFLTAPGRNEDVAVPAAAWWSPQDGMKQAWAPLSPDGSDAACDGSDAVAAAVRAATERAATERTATVTDATSAAMVSPRRAYNGYVFGGPDQWSSPSYRYDSAGARDSLAAMAASGADTAEVIVQWYVTDWNSTDIYAVTDPASALRTSTDSELAAIIAEARALGLKTMLTLMLDPDWQLVSQNWCRGNPNHVPGCHWRGEIGVPWGDSCAAGSQWARFFAGYTAQVVRYARLADAWGVDAYLLSHELQRATEVCPDLWAAQLAAVRTVYHGAVSAAFNPDGPNILPAAVAAAPWVRALDFIGERGEVAAPPLRSGVGGGHEPAAASRLCPAALLSATTHSPLRRRLLLYASAATVQRAWVSAARRRAPAAAVG